MTDFELEDLKDLPVPRPDDGARRQAMAAAMAAFEAAGEDLDAQTQESRRPARPTSTSHSGDWRGTITSPRIQYRIAATILLAAILIPAAVEPIRQRIQRNEPAGRSETANLRSESEPLGPGPANVAVGDSRSDPLASLGPNNTSGSMVGRSEPEALAARPAPTASPSAERKTNRVVEMVRDPSRNRMVLHERGPESAKGDAPALPAVAAPAAQAAAAMNSTGLADITLGSDTAPVTIVAYSSLTCAHCASFAAQVFPALKARYIDTGQVRFIVRDFPLDQLAVAAAMLPRCAGPDKAFALIETLLASQDRWASGPGEPADRLFEVARTAGFNRETFEACLSDLSLVEKLTAARATAARNQGVVSTPTFFVNGERLTGNQGAEEFDKAIARLLAK